MFYPAKIIAAVLAAVVMWGAAFAAVTSHEDAAVDCVQSQVTIDISSLERIYLQPETILADIDAFWTDDRAYWLTARWHDEVGYPVPPFGWQQIVEKFAAIPFYERDTITAVQQARKFMAGKDEFLAYAIPHLCSFLPDGFGNLGTTVYITTAIVPNGFQKNFDVVINAGSHRWDNDGATVWNTIIHEIFHVGYYRSECLATEIPLNSAEKHDLIYSLLNEGMATYVAYLASPVYPGHQDDYAKLEDDEAVKKALTQMNALIEEAESDSADVFRKNMFEVGVQRRALYVAGSYMAKTIDENLGREALVRVLATGPRSFITTYNSLVEKEWQLTEYRLPEKLSVFQRLRQAAVAGDYNGLKAIITEARNRRADIISPAGHALQTTGQLMLRRDSLDVAIEVFDLYREFFPDHGNPYRGLGEAYAKKGDTPAALAHFEKLLELVPGDALAHDMIARLKSGR